VGQNLGEDEITLWDFVVDSVDKMEETEKLAISRVMLCLLACEADGELNMRRVAMLVERLTGGSLEFGRAR
jgi:hypothetical protein